MKIPDFETVYVNYFSCVYKFVYSLSRNENVAEEITQETFFKALKNIKSYNGTCKINVWLCQIAKNTYFDYLKKEKKSTSLEEKLEITSKLDIEKDYLRGEDIKKLHFLLHHLEEPYKEVFTLRIFGNLSFQEIAELFGKTDSWARVIFFRAKKKLQEDMI